MAVYGYARVSTGEQDLTIQRETFTKAGCTIIREEKRSGTSLEGREELATLLAFLRPGDTLMVTRIDRLARSNQDFQNIYADLTARGVKLKCTEQPIMDTDGALGGLMVNILAAFAEFETRLRRERQLEGIAKAKADARYAGKGRPRKIDREEIMRRRLAKGRRQSRAAALRKEANRMTSTKQRYRREIEGAIAKAKSWREVVNRRRRRRGLLLPEAGRAHRVGRKRA
jgi:DNA invertase Pin-like site-specific DNA recombinase